VESHYLTGTDRASYRRPSPAYQPPSPLLSARPNGSNPSRSPSEVTGRASSRTPPHPHAQITQGDHAGIGTAMDDELDPDVRTQFAQSEDDNLARNELQDALYMSSAASSSSGSSAASSPKLSPLADTQVSCRCTIRSIDPLTFVFT
jgi:hypothetical protein